VTRAFVAVVPPPAVLDAVDELERPDLTGIRFSHREKQHVTLQFLGNRVDLDAAETALRELAVQPGEVRLGGGGAFPSPKRGKVLWIGVVEGGPLLTQLAAAVGALLGPAGYPPEDRPFNPHVTLARCKRPMDLRAAVAALGEDPVGPAWTVEDVVLFESTTRPTGAEYVARARIDLGGT
jgi:RNA 2',3'-cyclic 3'-phosphodiesterase